MLSLQSQWPEAQLHLARAVALHPALAEGWVELGVVRFSEGKYEPALADFDRARQLQPNDPRIHYERGRALSLLKRSEESVASFRQAIRSNPNYWEAHYGLGGELGMHNHISEAGKEFAEVVRLQPDFAAGHLNLGVALMKSGQLEAAEQQFEETLRLEPADKIASDYLRQLRTLKQRKP
jgi:tetratricopeptide (TPR) repeat protein